MQSFIVRLLAISTVCLGLQVASAHAQFGLPGLPGPRIGVPLPVPGVRVGPGVVPLPMPGVYGRNGFGRTFGIIGAVAVGAIILNRMTVHDRREVTRRARVVVENKPDEQVVDTYRSKDGRHAVTVTAEPVRPASDFAGDPALASLDDPAKQDKAPGAATPPKGTAVAKGKPGDKPETADLVRLTELPADSTCRRVTTEYEASATNVAPKKKGPEPTTTEAKETHVSIMCRTESGWKPAGA